MLSCILLELRNPSFVTDFEQIVYPPSNPDMNASDYYLFLNLKTIFEVTIFIEGIFFRVLKCCFNDVISALTSGRIILKNKILLSTHFLSFIIRLEIFGASLVYLNPRPKVKQKKLDMPREFHLCLIIFP